MDLGLFCKFIGHGLVAVSVILFTTEFEPNQLFRQEGSTGRRSLFGGEILVEGEVGGKHKERKEEEEEEKLAVEDYSSNSGGGWVLRVLLR